jgi:hypothetical protein
MIDHGRGMSKRKGVVARDRMTPAVGGLATYIARAPAIIDRVSRSRRECCGCRPAPRWRHARPPGPDDGGLICQVGPERDPDSGLAVSELVVWRMSEPHLLRTQMIAFRGRLLPAA